MLAMPTALLATLLLGYADGPKVVVDTTEAPDLADWGKKAGSLCEEWYPKIVAYLGAPRRPVREVRLFFKKDMDGVAYAAGSRITISADYVRGHSGDFGMVVHELTHVVQNYPGGSPGWLVEGIADYVRIIRYEPDARRPRIDPRRASYKDAYKTTAQFLDFVQRAHAPDLVPALGRACRAGEYRPELFRDLAGRPLDDLWAEFAATLPAR